MIDWNNPEYIKLDSGKKCRNCDIEDSSLGFKPRLAYWIRTKYKGEILPGPSSIKS